MSVLLLAVIFTTRSTGLYYTEYVYNPHQITSSVDSPFGKLYVLMQLHIFAVVLSAVWCAFYSAVKRRGKFIGQAVGFVTAFLFPVFSYFIRPQFFSAANGGPIKIDLTVFCSTAAAVTVFFVIRRYEMLDLTGSAVTKALSHMREGYVLLDANFCYIDSNYSALRIFPDLHFLEKHKPITCITDFPYEKLQKSLAYAYEKKSQGGVYFTYESNAKHYRFNITEKKLDRGTVVGYIILINDETEMIQMFRKLETAAYNDELTGLHSRRYFMERAGLMVKKARRVGESCCLFMTDLDHFKNVNDVYGHLAGDTVLRTTACVFLEKTRPYDVLGRYGGEEFVLITTGCDFENAAKIAERLRYGIESNRVVYDEKIFSVTVSIGAVYLHPNDKLKTNSEDGIEELSELLRLADEALYKAKGSVRNRTVFVPFSAAEQM